MAGMPSGPLAGSGPRAIFMRHLSINLGGKLRATITSEMSFFFLYAQLLTLIPRNNIHIWLDPNA